MTCSIHLGGCQRFLLLGAIGGIRHQNGLSKPRLTAAAPPFPEADMRTPEVRRTYSDDKTRSRAIPFCGRMFKSSL